MSHNSDSTVLPGFGEASPQGEFIKGMLSGSQAKTAFAIRMNAERMIREDGLNSSGLLTLTVGDYFCAKHDKQIPNFKDHCPVCKRENKIRKMIFRGVSDSAEASRRVNNLRAFILTIFKRCVLVTERHKSMNIHFHLLGSLASGADIRTGFDFAAVKRRNYRSVPDQLRAVWRVCRAKLPHYGFGRHELMPIQKTGEAVAAYVSKYIEKNVCNRTPSDKRKKLVRYLGWKKNQLKPNEFEWDGVKARAWRAKTAQIFHVAGCELRDAEITPEKRITEDCASAAGKIRPKMLDGSEIKKKFGARWAFVGTGIWSEIEGDNVLPFIDWTPRKKRIAIALLDEAQNKFERKILGNFRWLKGLIFDRMEKWEEMDAKRQCWADEFEANGLELDSVFFDFAKIDSEFGKN